MWIKNKSFYVHGTDSANERLFNTTDGQAVGKERRWMVGLGWSSRDGRRGPPGENKTNKIIKRKTQRQRKKTMSELF